MNSNSRMIVDEREALSAYFRALLSEGDVEEQPKVEVVVAKPETEVVVELAQEVIELTRVKETIQPAPLKKPVPAPVQQSEPVPEWGQEKFQVMLFKVSGLSLAVPLAELNGVQEWQDDVVTPMPGHAPWYLGLVNYRDRQVPVIDTARFVMPQDRQDMVIDDVNERLHRIVYIGDESWGLACDEVAEVITIEPEQVRWRSNRTSRRWLAGTVIEQMCALIDPPVFAEMLATGMNPEDRGI